MEISLPFRAWRERIWKWRRWYAWRPILYTGFANAPEYRDKLVWLQWVERRVHNQVGRRKYWIYRSTAGWTGKAYN